MKKPSNAYQEMGRLLRSIENVTENSSSVGLTSVSTKEGEYLDDKSLNVKLGLEVRFIDSKSINETVTLTPCNVELEEGGKVFVEFEASIRKQSSGEESDNSAGEFSEIEPVRLNDDITTPSEEKKNEVETDSRGSKEGSSSPKEKSKTEDTTLPSYQDEEELEKVYEEKDTFAEMTEALDVEVTPQTVRRYMIQYGIHEPSSPSGATPVDKLINTDPESIPLLNDKKDDREKESEQLNSEAKSQSASNRTLVPDGQGVSKNNGREKLPRDNEDTKESGNENEENYTNAALGEENGEKIESKEKEESEDTPKDIETTDNVSIPQHLSLEEIKTVVSEAKTLYEAEQALNLERNETQDLLQDLDLIDFVQGRLATREIKGKNKEEIDRRLQSKTTSSDE